MNFKMLSTIVVIGISSVIMQLIEFTSTDMSLIVQSLILKSSQHFFFQYFNIKVLNTLKFFLFRVDKLFRMAQKNGPS